MLKTWLVAIENHDPDLLDPISVPQMFEDPSLTDPATAGEDVQEDQDGFVEGF
jgi:hypothetical protein